MSEAGDWIDRQPRMVLLASWALLAVAGIFYLLPQYPPVNAIGPLTYIILAAAVVVAPLDDRLRLGAALTLGLLARLIAYSTISAAAIADDPGTYSALADSILAGNGLVTHNETYGILRANYPPLYPIVLAGFRAVGLDYLALNLLCDLCASLFLYKLSGRSARAAVTYFLFPSVLLAGLLPEKEGLASLLLLGNMMLIKRSPLAYGAVAGLLALTQPAWLPVAVIAFLIANPRVKPLAWAAMGGVVVLLPWWVRNYWLFGQFIPLTSGSALTLAAAVNGRHVPTIGLPFDEPGRAAFAGWKAIENILADPLHYLLNTAKTTIRSFMVDDDPADYVIGNGARWGNAAMLCGQLAWVALLAGAARSKARIDGVLAPFVVAWIANVLLIGIWLEFSSRHRAFAVPLLILLVFWKEVSGRAPIAPPTDRL